MKAKGPIDFLGAIFIELGAVALLFYFLPQMEFKAPEPSRAIVSQSQIRLKPKPVLKEPRRIPFAAPALLEETPTLSLNDGVTQSLERAEENFIGEVFEQLRPLTTSSSDSGGVEGLSGTSTSGQTRRMGRGEYPREYRY